MLFGIRFLRKGLTRLIGSRLEDQVQALAASPMKGFASGLGMACLVPSSTSINLLAIQMLHSGMARAKHLFAVVLGADIGITLMIVVISFKLDSLAPLFFALGVLLFQFVKSEKLRGCGQILMSLGFIFLGMSFIRLTAGNIEPGGEVETILNILANHPYIMMFVVALITVVLQSTTATLGLFLGLTASGVITLPLMINIVLGVNIGMGLSMLLLGWHLLEARRLAVMNLISKLVVAAIALQASPYIVDLLQNSISNLDQQIAAMHTGFNLIKAVVWLPLVGGLAIVVSRMLHQPPQAEVDAFGPMYLQHASTEEPTLALGQSMREINRVAEIVRSMLDDVWQAITENSEALAEQVRAKEEQVDILDQKVRQFFAQLSFDHTDANDTRGEMMRQLVYLNELETIGDVIDKNLASLAYKQREGRMTIAPEEWRPVRKFYDKVSENLLIAETAFLASDHDLTEKLIRHHKVLGRHQARLKSYYLAKLSGERQGFTLSDALVLDTLTYLYQINGSVTHMAYAAIALSGNAVTSTSKPKSQATSEKIATSSPSENKKSKKKKSEKKK